MLGQLGAGVSSHLHVEHEVEPQHGEQEARARTRQRSHRAESLARHAVVVFERFTDRARRVVVLAQEEARLLNHNYIGTEHLLLGLIHEGEGVAARSLESLGISLAVVRGRVEDIIGQGVQAPSGHIPFTPRSKKVLELSLREALALGHNYIGTEHILLGLIREGEGVAAQVLVALGASLEAVRARVLATLPERENLATLRHDYETEGLERADLADNPIVQFQRWYDDAADRWARGAERDDAGTVDEHGQPDARVVLLRGVDERGFVWFTNRNSRKGRELAANPRAALVFLWVPLAPPGPRDGIGDADRRRGVGRLLRDAAAREPDRRVGVGAERGARRPSDARPRRGRDRGALPSHRGASATALGRLPPRARDARGLAGPGQPAPRPLPLLA